MPFRPPGGGGGGGSITLIESTDGGVTVSGGTGPTTNLLNVANLASASTQAFTGKITSNGDIGGQRIVSSVLATGAFIGRHDGGPPVGGTHSAGDWSVDYTTPGVWMTSAGGSPPSDWVNIGQNHLFSSLGYTLAVLTGVNAPVSLGFGNLYDLQTMTGTAPGNLPAASSATAVNWLTLSRQDASAFNFTIAPHAGDTINGSTTPIPISPGESVTLVSDSTSNWLLI